MKSNLAEIKEMAQRLDTAAVQWMNAGPPESIQAKLNQAREHLKKGEELADAPLRIAVVGEFNSGKTLLLNSLLDATDLFPCLLQPTTGNVLEARVHLIKEERQPSIRKSSVSFFNQFEIEKILQHFVKNLRTHSIEGLPSDVTMNNLDQFEQFIMKKFSEVKSATPKYALISALEYIMALKEFREVVDREERVVANLPRDLINSVLTLDKRPDLSKGIQSIHQEIKQRLDKGKSGSIEKISSTNVRALFPIIRRVEVDIDAWCAPFGVTNPDDHNTIAFLDFPGLGAEGSNARDEYLCMSEIEDAHAVLLVFNGSNPGTSGASVMATLFQRVGKLTAERTLVAVNRFDEFHPLPTGKNVEEYYATSEQGTTVGFSTILVPAKNAIGVSSKPKLYICSALCYLFDEKAKRPSWNFGNAQWFNDNKRQAAYTLYKRSQEDFKALIGQVGKSKGRSMLQDHQIMKDGLEKYMEGAGVPSLRSDLVHFTMERGERLIKEDAMKEIRSAQKILDEVAPSGTGTGDKSVNAEVSFSAQEFYRVLELAVADTLPSGPSDYKKLKMRVKEEDVPLWDLIESEIAASVTCWPEWFAILNQSTVKPQRSGQPQKAFGRYKNLKKSGAEVPTEFSAFDERFQNTAEELTSYTLECIQESIRYSLQRFEEHPDYRSAIEHLQSMVDCQRLTQMEEALPLLDVWNPTELAEGEEGIVALTTERIQDEVEALRTMSYPYDGSKPCHWNLALIIRIQVQLMKTYRDRLSRLVAAAENNFQDFYCNEVLRAEILPLVRSSLNNADFLGEVATVAPGSSWENVGQVVRSAVDDFKSKHSAPLKPGASRQQEIIDEPPGKSMSGNTVATKTVAKAPQKPAVQPQKTVAQQPVEEESFDDGFEEDHVEEPQPPKTRGQQVSNQPKSGEPGEVIDEDEFEEW